MTGCGGSSTTSGPASVGYTAASGVAQKGPLQQGSTFTAQELDANLSPNGKQYSYQITSNLGTFSPTSTFTSRYIGLIATGYYFDEVAGNVSAGSITLNGYSDLGTDSVLNVNLLTTLTYQRIQTLMSKSNLTFAAARTQAEGEVLGAFGISNPGSYGSFSTLDIGKGTDAANILAAISSLFVYGNTSGTLSGLIANVQSDIGANGAITNTATRQILAAAARALNASAIASNLNQEYASSGVTFTAGSISNWLDQDGDGVVGKYKYQVADAGPSSVFLITGVLSSAEIYDPVTNSWSPAASMASARAAHTATLLSNGEVLVAGGITDVVPDATASAEIYDPATDNWSPAGSMNDARSLHVAALLPNGRVLVAGGSADSVSAEIFDPATNGWMVTASLSDARNSIAALALAGRNRAGRRRLLRRHSAQQRGSIQSGHGSVDTYARPGHEPWKPELDAAGRRFGSRGRRVE